MRDLIRGSIWSFFPNHGTLEIYCRGFCDQSCPVVAGFYVSHENRSPSVLKEEPVNTNQKLSLPSSHKLFQHIETFKEPKNKTKPKQNILKQKHFY